MFDTMTLTKIVGGFCGMFLLFLLGGWAAENIYHTEVEAHDGEEHQQAYVIPVEESGGGDAGGEEVAFADLWAAADASAGEGVYRNCRSCHAIEPGVNGTGPTLYGVVGREVDSVPGFNYSGALEQVVQVWEPEALFHFLENPRGYAPGTAMTYSGLKPAEDRVNLIAYLDSLDN